MAVQHRFKSIVAELWAASRPLTGVGLLMLAALAVSAAGLWLDPREITGMPAWLKPAKFAASTAIYSFTLAWLFTYLAEWPRVRRFVGWTTALVFVLEVAIIDTQAWRGTTSHFNLGTPLDAALFALMGTAIIVQTLVSVGAAVALWRQRFADEALGWAARLGMTLTIIGAASGGLMTRPTTAQLAEAETSGRIVLAGAHTVGAPDGGPGIAGTGWSTEHGDLRVPHFIGLHAMQTLPLFALLLARRGYDERRRVRASLAVGSSYAALFALLLWQALRGQSVVAPDGLAVATFAVWAAATAIAARAALSRHQAAPFTTAMVGQRE